VTDDDFPDTSRLLEGLTGLVAVERFAVRRRRRTVVRACRQTVSRGRSRNRPRVSRRVGREC